jgi:hypothetical protein
MDEQQPGGHAPFVSAPPARLVSPAIGQVPRSAGVGAGDLPESAQRAGLITAGMS